MSGIRKTSRPYRGAVAVVTAMLVSLGLLLPVALGDDSIDEDLAQRRGQAAALLVQAQGELTFDILMPAWLPDGYELEYIGWFLPEEPTELRASTVDLWFSTPGKPRIHLWQTDMPASEIGAKDPVGRGERVRSEEQPDWFVESGLRTTDALSATAMSARLADGLTVSVDGGITTGDLTRVAHSLEPLSTDASGD